MVTSNSTTNKNTLISQDNIHIDIHNNNLVKMSSTNNNLRRAPSLPPIPLGKDIMYDVLEEEEDEDEPRMGDLIRQAMPIVSVSSRKLDRMSSLPPCKVANEVLSNVSKDENGENLCRIVSVVESSMVRDNNNNINNNSCNNNNKKGPIGMSKLSRRVSMDPSMILPPTPKGTYQISSNSKNKTLKNQETSNMNTLTKIEESKIKHLGKSKSQMNLIDLEIQELQACKDLGFSIDDNHISPTVKKILPGLQRGASLDSRPRRPPNRLSEAWRKPSPPLSGPLAAAALEPKDELSQDMKAQLKYWARAVASNMRQKC